MPFYFPLLFLSCLLLPSSFFLPLTRKTTNTQQMADLEVSNDALLAQILYEEEQLRYEEDLRCMNDAQIATMVNQIDLQKIYYEPLKKLQTTPLRSMTIEEQAAYYYLHGSKKYKDIGEENDFYVIASKKGPKPIPFRLADKKKDEEYAIVLTEDNSKVICEFLDRKKRLCRKSIFFVSNFHHVDRGDGVIVRLRGESGKLVFKYTNPQWVKVFESGQLAKMDGLNKLPHELLAHVIAELKNTNRYWFKSLLQVNTVFRDIVKFLL